MCFSNWQKLQKWTKIQNQGKSDLPTEVKHGRAHIHSDKCKSYGYIIHKLRKHWVATETGWHKQRLKLP